MGLDPYRPQSPPYPDAKVRKHAYSCGQALRTHCDSAHDGKVDPNCNACKEIQKRMEQIESAKK